MNWLKKFCAAAKSLISVVKTDCSKFRIFESAFNSDVSETNLLSHFCSHCFIRSVAIQIRRVRTRKHTKDAPLAILVFLTWIFFGTMRLFSKVLIAPKGPPSFFDILQQTGF